VLGIWESGRLGATFPIFQQWTPPSLQILATGRPLNESTNFSPRVYLGVATTMRRAENMENMENYADSGCDRPGLVSPCGSSSGTCGFSRVAQSRQGSTLVSRSWQPGCTWLPGWCWCWCCCWCWDSIRRAISSEGTQEARPLVTSSTPCPPTRPCCHHIGSAWHGNVPVMRSYTCHGNTCSGSARDAPKRLNIA